MPPTIYTVDQAAGAITDGSITAVDTAQHQVTATARPCKRLRVRMNSTNAGKMFFGNVGSQNIWNTASEERVISVDDPSKIYYKAANSGDGFAYWIEN